MLELRVGWVGGLVGSGREGPVVCPLAPGGKLGCQRDKSDFFLLQQGQKFRLPSPHCGGESRVSYLRRWWFGASQRTVSDRAAAGGPRMLCFWTWLEWPGRRHFSGVGVCGFVENCFSAWDETSSRWPSPCVGHSPIKRPIKQRTENHWRWWQYRCLKGEVLDINAVRACACVCVHLVLYNLHKNWTLWMEFQNLSAN